MRKALQSSKLCLQAKQKIKQPICKLCKVKCGDVLTTEVLGFIWSHQLPLGTNCSHSSFPPRQQRHLLLHFSPY